MDQHTELQIHFYDNLRETAMILRSNASGDLATYGELLMFNCLALRQILNLKGSAFGSALVLYLKGLDSNTIELPDLVVYRGFGNPALFCSLDWGGPKALFQLNPKGLGIFSLKTQPCFYLSVPMFVTHLVRTHAADDDFIHKLRRAQHMCGNADQGKMVSTSSAPALAIQIADYVSVSPETTR
jgi:hypothetical protein